MATFARISLWVVVAAAAFHAAYASVHGSLLIVLYLFALLQLAQAGRWRLAFYPGLAVGLLIAVARLGFFWVLFSGAAIALWFVYAFWIGLFVALARLCLTRFGRARGFLLVPFVWAGLEYFRSELYYLRFSWLSIGYAFAEAPWQAALRFTGVYGAGLLLAGVAAAAVFCWQKSKVRAAVVLVLGAGAFALGGDLVGSHTSTPGPGVRVAGVQMEFPLEAEVVLRLNDLIREHPDTELAVLSEYTFTGPVPDPVREWCREHSRYLVVGGKAPATGTNFYNTAFVIGPDGDIVFRQVKAVPIQFMNDGLAAPEQKVWDSPWGKIGICICYDLSYTRVNDRLVRQGAQALIVPTMDVADWGQAQHELHARIAPVRATEHRLPIFRLASSGISQLTDHAGRVLASAPCPGDGVTLAGTLELRGTGRLPADRWLAPFSVAVTAVLMVMFFLHRPRASHAPSEPPKTHDNPPPLAA
ncbi:MAG TPA: nitrilase-related carbon-nitrogen hydrolase [Candidatus Paceibacterota bacterium]|nr:nitrilase-related carbon-nitrogen hydrolase [Verrucomicrobiota bacterium]HSA09598.1 nitrilase-related carbon-nitrogen hydrolase [Candidatus Paceibacterota bacterium]